MIDGPVEVLRRALEGREIDGFRLRPRDFKPGRTERETYFNLFLEREGLPSLRPVVQGLYFMGRGEYIKAWMEFRYEPRAEFPGAAVDLEERGLTAGLFALLGGMIPPGGSMMVIYGAEPHPLSADTERGLKRSFPPPATPLGYYLWKTGLRWFKDWYFPEGWMEGGMKLQATRPLDEGIRAERERKAREELQAFVASMEGRTKAYWEEDALERAKEIISTLAAGDR